MSSMYRFSTVALICAVALAACGQKESAPSAASSAPAAASAPVAPAAAPAAPAAAPAPVAAADDAQGKSAYGKVCAMCHASGAAGAPKPGDKAEWAPRIAQGPDTLYKHALEGFTGAKGVMPARGGSTMADADVKAAVDYMVAQSR
jgi:cytochrome c5